MLPALLPILASGLGTLLDRLIPDAHEREKAKAEVEARMAEAAINANLEQIEVNKVEAGHTSLWVAGWRPAIGWVCAASLAVYYIPAFLVGAGLWLWASVEAKTLLPRPEMGVGDVVALVLSLLGLGGLRTIEKSKGVK